ncbi:hypothetical protein TNIN_158741 [Trichonephila inaurata madagascariensis]|uniref:Uncharacterized protein n=1 Tax=Trichonephila inaurata madagascariensis TaxID=2747483 RepID=A0A8X7BPD2_9ARAC|nr:hypothetical protein TNIN_158741 [Trichonephila inaurata madagascariensis]
MHRDKYVRSESDSDTSGVEDHPLAHTSEHAPSKSDQHMGRLTPKKGPLTKKDIKSSVKKMKTKISDSSSEVPCTVADVSKSRRHSSVATLPLRESPQISSSNVNETLNTSVKRSQSCVKDIKRITLKIPRPSSNLVITTPEIHNEEGPLRKKPSSVTKKIHVSKTGTEPFQPCIDSTKDTRQIIQNQRNYAESDSDASTVEYTLTHASKYLTSKIDQHTRLVSPKNQNDIGNNGFSGIDMSPVKNKKKRNSENNFRL